MKLTLIQSDTLKELINIGVGRAASILHQMLNTHVSLNVPFLKLVGQAAFRSHLNRDDNSGISGVKLEFTGDLSGTAALVFPEDSANRLTVSLTGIETDDADFDEMKTGTLNEIGNIVINGVMGSLANITQQNLSYSTPTYIEKNLAGNLIDEGQAISTIVLAQTQFSIQELDIKGDVVLVFEVGDFAKLLTVINALNGEDAEAIHKAA